MEKNDDEDDEVEHEHEQSISASKRKRRWRAFSLLFFTLQHFPFFAPSPAPAAVDT